MTGVPAGAVRGRLRAAATPDLAQAIRQGRLRDAERLCRSILETEPDRVDVHHNLGNVLCALRRPREAIVCNDLLQPLLAALDIAPLDERSA